MRRLVFSALAIAQAALILAPGAVAAPKVGLETLIMRGSGGEPISIAGEGKAVTFLLTVNNKGDEDFHGSVTVVFRVNSTSGVYDQSFTVTNTLAIPVNGTATIPHEWTPVKTGDHTVNAYNAADPSVRLSLPFEVQKTEVLRGTLVDRVVQYGWLYALFMGLSVLFVAVVRLRKPRF